MSALAPLLALLCAAAPSPLRARTSRPAVVARADEAPGRPASGAVLYVTAERAFLDRGQGDGLRPGLTLQLLRRGRPLGTCQVERTAQSSASCVGKRFAAGDTFKLPGPAPAAPSGPQPRPLPAPSPTAELSRRRGAVEAAPFEPVEYASEPLLVAPLRASLALRHDAALALAWQQAGFQLTQVELRLLHLRPLPQALPGLAFSAELSALQWLGRPANGRWVSEASTRLWVRTAEVRFRPASSLLSLAAGRTHPAAAPGLYTLDGVQLGLAQPGGGLEGGLFAGAVPGPFDLGLAPDRWTLGAYFGAALASEEGGRGFLRAATRLALVTRPSAGQRLEVEPALYGKLGQGLTASAQARLAFLAEHPAQVDSARVDLTARPFERLTLGAGARYQGSTELTLSTELFGLPSRGYHAEAFADLALGERLTLSARAAGAFDEALGAGRALVGPELAFPGLMGPGGGLQLGYQEELGWIRGRNGYAQLSFSAFQRAVGTLRAAYFQSQPGPGREGDASHEASLYLSLEVRLARWLSARGWGLVRSELSAARAQGTRAFSPLGARLQLQLVGEL